MIKGRKTPEFLGLLLSVVIILILLSPSIFAEYRYGDINRDGWCNIGDLVALTCSPSFQCYHAADINGDGMIGGGDITMFVNYFGHLVTPAVECTLSVLPCEEFSIQAIIYMGPADIDQSTLTATVPVYITSTNSPSTEVSSFFFSLMYDPSIFTSGSFTSSNIQLGDAMVYESTFPESYGSQPYNIVEVSWLSDQSGCSTTPLGTDTYVFDLNFTMATPQSDSTYYLCVLDEHPTMGPPRFYFDIEEGSQMGDDCLHIYCPTYIVGDVNGDRVPTGGDVTYLVNYFRGINQLKSQGFHCVRIVW